MNESTKENKGHSVDQSVKSVGWSTETAEVQHALHLPIPGSLRRSHTSTIYSLSNYHSNFDITGKYYSYLPFSDLGSCFNHLYVCGHVYVYPWALHFALWRECPTSGPSEFDVNSFPLAAPSKASAKIFQKALSIDGGF